MSNPTINAFTTIRNAVGLTPQRPLMKNDQNPPDLLGVIKLEILPRLNPWVKWYRHPIYWWKWRHFRRDVKVMSEAVDPEFKQKLDEELERKFLCGTGVKEEDVDHDTYH